MQKRLKQFFLRRNTIFRFNDDLGSLFSLAASMTDHIIGINLLTSAHADTNLLPPVPHFVIAQLVKQQGFNQPQLHLAFVKNPLSVR